MPLFSIIIPTRQRAHLLRYALQSALDQTFSDFEIIVSNNGADPATEQVVAELRDSRVKYYFTDEVLSMPEHWEFALCKANGSWVTFLTDRYILTPYCLAKIAEIVQTTKTELVCWRNANYYHQSSQEVDRVNQLEIPHVTQALTTIDSRQALNYFYNLEQEGLILPSVTLAFCNREIIGKLKKGGQKFFSGAALDFYSAIKMLSAVESYTVYDGVLGIAGNCRESSSGSSRVRGESTAKFFAEFKGQELLKYVPLKLRLPVNGIADALLNVKEELPERLDQYKMNWKNYFRNCYLDIFIMESYGVDARQEKKHYLSVLLRQPLPIIFSAAKFVMFRSFIVSLKKLANKYGWFSFIKSYIERRRRKKMIVVRGEDFGFNNILEAGRKLAVILTELRTPHN